MNTTTTISLAIETARSNADKPTLSARLRRRLSTVSRPHALRRALEDAAVEFTPNDLTQAYWSLQAACRI